MQYVVFSVEVTSKEVEVPDTVPENDRDRWACDKAYGQPGGWDRSDIDAGSVDGSVYKADEVPSELCWA
jgi:hypothetical protein